MLRYLIRRLLWAIVLFLAVTVVTYVIFFIIPSNPAARVCGKSCGPAD
ncbi:MAG: ABC transporter permease, partial [Gaiellaceae bacterium]